MATKLFNTDLTFSESYPYLIPIVFPADKSEGISLDENIDLAIPICTSTLNTALGRGATAVINKTARTAEIFDLSDWVSSKLSFSSNITSDSGAYTVDHIGIYGASTPSTPDDIIWERLNFSVEAAQIQLLSTGLVPDILMVVVRINPYGGATTKLPGNEIWTVTVDDELEMDVYNFVEEIADGVQQEVPNDIKIIL